MTYLNYLQQGGEAANIQLQAIELVKAAKDGNEQAQLQIEQILQAAQQGDPQAAQIAEIILAAIQELQGTEALKCGGKAKKKVVKAACGKKAEEGMKIPNRKNKLSKGGCPCLYRRIGGKLIEVNSCTGLPIHAEGGNILFLLDGNEMTYNPYESLFTSSKPAKKTSAKKPSKQLSEAELQKLSDMGILMFDPTTKEVSAPQVKDPRPSSAPFPYTEEGFNALTAELQRAALANQPLTTKTAPATVVTEAPVEVPAEAPKAAVPGTVVKKTPKVNYAALYFTEQNAGDLAKMNWKQRQEWLTTGAGKDYIATLDDVTKQKLFSSKGGTYTGTFDLNKALAQAYQGFGAWKEAQEAAKAKPVGTYGNELSNRELLEWDASNANNPLLSEEALARQKKLQEAALTFNGQTYTDEDAYNAAVNDYNQPLMQKRAKFAADKYRLVGKDRRLSAAWDNMEKAAADANYLNTLSNRDKLDIKRLQRLGVANNLWGADNSNDYFTTYNPVIAALYSPYGNLTEEQLNAVSYRQGGLISYSEYLK